MLEVPLGRSLPRPHEAATRREFLRLSGLSSLALTWGGPPCPQSAAAEPTPGPARSVILLFLGGGLSHLDSFDPKPEAPDAIRGPGRSIATRLPGIRISALLPRLSHWLDRLVLVRSLCHDCQHHETASNWLLSGRRGSAFGDHPALGAVLSALSPSSSVPIQVAVPRNPAFTWELGTSAYLGPCHAAIPSGSPRRANARWDQHLSAQQLAQLQDRYGSSTFAQSCLLARRLVETGVRFVTLADHGWDHHAQLGPALEGKLPPLDAGLSGLLEDLHERGLLEQTLVVLASEFGRSPQMNRQGGRDHWGRAGSLLLAGAGIQAGQVIGGTDRYGAHVYDRPVHPADLACTILKTLNIAPETPLRAPDGRTRAILDGGTPIHELWGGRRQVCSHPESRRSGEHRHRM